MLASGRSETIVSQVSDRPQASMSCTPYLQK